MRFTPTPLPGLTLVEMERFADPRGYFARTWCAEEFRQAGLNPVTVQCSTSFNHRRGTLRGLHYQLPPHAEDKLVRCTRGAIFDVAVDLRPDSPTFKQWYGAELTAENGRALYLPKGFAHGFQTLADDSEVFYQMSDWYHPASARAVRWNSPWFNIAWPVPDPILSDRDRDLPTEPPLA